MPSATRLLRQVVTIQSPPTTSLGKWTTFAIVRAQIVPQASGEVARGLEPATVAVSMVAIRYLSGVKPKMRLIFGNRTLEISSVNNEEERNHWINLMCREVQN